MLTNREQEEIEDLRERCGGYWGECPGAPVKDWQHEIEENTTRMGYWEWAYFTTGEGEAR